MAKKSRPKNIRVRTSVSVAHCQFQWPTPKRCWLCGVLVPANTLHECWKGKP